MKKVIGLAICILLTIATHAQTQTIAEADIKHRVPNDKWELKSSKTTDYPHVYTYKRAPITDKNHREIIPNLSFIIEEVADTTDIVLYSTGKRERLKFNVLDAFTALSKPKLLKHKYALGFKGTYTDSKQLEHTIYYVIYIHKGKAIQVVCDVTSELFDSCKAEFDAVISSVENIHPYAYDGSLTQETIKMK